MSPVTAPPAGAIEDVDPATGRVLATIPCAERHAVERAVAAAGAAQPGWGTPGLEGRGEVLERAAAGFEDGDTGWRPVGPRPPSLSGNAAP